MAQKVTSTDIKLALKEFHNGKPSYFITECKTCSTYFPDPQGLLKFDEKLRRAITMATKNVNVEAVQAEETEKKEAVNILDLLLGSDVGEIKLPTKEVEITRLSQVYGAPFILTIKAITPAKFEEIQDMSIDVKGKDADIDITQLQLFTVIEGVVDATGAPMFKNKELMSKFKVSTPKDLVRAILLSGEIAKIYGEISELAGFGDNAVKEVKNS